jgi:hypothetical protein
MRPLAIRAPRPHLAMRRPTSQYVAVMTAFERAGRGALDRRPPRTPFARVIASVRVPQDTSIANPRAGQERQSVWRPPVPGVTPDGCNPTAHEVVRQRGEDLPASQLLGPEEPALASLEIRADRAIPDPLASPRDLFPCAPAQNPAEDEVGMLRPTKCVGIAVPERGPNGVGEIRLGASRIGHRMPRTRSTTTRRAAANRQVVLSTSCARPNVSGWAGVRPRPSPLPAVAVSAALANQKTVLPERGAERRRWRRRHRTPFPWLRYQK